MAPATLYLVHHPECKTALELSKAMYDWFRLGDLSGAQSGAGLPVYFRRQIDNQQIAPAIDFAGAELNVIVLLVDEQVVFDPAWRIAVVELVKQAQSEEKPSNSRRSRNSQDSKSLILPVALHESSYRLAPIYQNFNSIRLLDVSVEEKDSLSEAIAILRRHVTAAIAREMRGPDAPPLKIFLSHAKRDGRKVAESIRDDIRSIGQFEAWYDANDLPFGKEWEEPMQAAVSNDTAAMIAVRTDAFLSGETSRKLPIGGEFPYFPDCIFCFQGR